MKRTWQAGRVILAFLLLSMTGLAFYAWQRGPRWHIRTEQVIGFDLQQGLLFTTNGKIQQTGVQFELHGFDLMTGEQLVAKPILLEKPDPTFPTKWQAILSSDGSTMVCYDSISSILVFDVRGECQQLFSIKQIIDSIALSSHGELLAIRSLDDVQVWDRRTGKIMYRLNRAAKTVGRFSEIGLVRCHPEYLQFSGDGRYLAVGGNEAAIDVFDMTTGQALGHCPDSLVPCFLPDNRTLIAMPAILGTGKVQWYQLEEVTIKPLALSRQIDPLIERLLGASPKQLLTFQRNSTPRRNLPTWLPAPLRANLETALGWTNHNLFIQSTNTSTGEVRDEFILRTNGRVDSRISPDGLLLALEEHKELYLWDIPPRRSSTCWLVCISFTLIALWIGWPRRQQAQSLGVTP